jgi:DNA-binding LacI/PurR family transcriptional regulator
VIDVHGVLPETMLRDLMLRGLKVVLVDAVPRVYSTSAVLIDRVLCANRLAQLLLRDAHTQIGVIERRTVERGESELLLATQQALHRLAPEAGAVQVRRDAVVAAADAGCTALICDGFDVAADAVNALRRNGIEVPARVSVAAMGIETVDGPRVSGYAVDPDQLAESIRLLLSESVSHRPTPLWLVGVFVDHGTVAPVRPTARARSSA